MRFTILTCLLAISLPLLGAEEPQLLESIRKSIDGVQTADNRFIWDDDGLRVEEKSWWEKGVDWFKFVPSLHSSCFGNCKFSAEC